MIPQEMRDLLNTLLKASKENRVKWVSSKQAGMPSSGGEDFVVTMSSYSLNVWRTELEGTAYFSILDAEGEVAASYHIDPSDDDYELLDAMLNSAQYSAANVDEIIQDLQKVLDEGGIIGEPPKSSSDDIPF